MALRNHHSVQLITLAQLKANLEVVYQDRDNLSEFKRPILQAIREYIYEIEGRVLSTDNSRLQLLQNIIDKLYEHDITFLGYVINQTLGIKDQNSSLRDKIGKAALLQNVRYVSGAVEFVGFAALAYSLLSGTGPVADLVSLAAILAVNSLQKSYFNTLLKHEAVRSGLTELNKNISSATVGDFLSLVGNYKFGELPASATNIFSNVSHFLRANLTFFGARVPDQAAAPELPAAPRPPG